MILPPASTLPRNLILLARSQLGEVASLKSEEEELRRKAILLSVPGKCH